ncbi:MAG: hypothetical protein Q4C67_10515 [Deinococcus sp.]|nr:hypothetical protein [Deinococcus sp.]
MALTFFVGLRWSSFLAPLGAGVVGMVLGFIGINSRAFGPWWPWTFPLLLTSVDDFPMTGPVLFNAALTLTFTALCLWNIRRRDA